MDPPRLGPHLVYAYNLDLICCGTTHYLSKPGAVTCETCGVEYGWDGHFLIATGAVEAVEAAAKKVRAEVWRVPTLKEVTRLGNGPA